MNVLNKYLSLLYNSGFLLAMLFTIYSCELEDSIDNVFQFADLQIYVSGTLSGNPRSGLRVAIYETEQDAIDEVNAIIANGFTDNDGLVFFLNLEPGFRYWVRVDTTLIRNIKRSQRLDGGYNEMSMTIL